MKITYRLDWPSLWLYAYLYFSSGSKDDIAPQRNICVPFLRLFIPKLQYMLHYFINVNIFLLLLKFRWKNLSRNMLIKWLHWLRFCVLFAKWAIFFGNSLYERDLYSAPTQLTYFRKSNERVLLAFLCYNWKYLVPNTYIRRYQQLSVAFSRAAHTTGDMENRKHAHNISAKLLKHYLFTSLSLLMRVEAATGFSALLNF